MTMRAIIILAVAASVSGAGACEHPSAFGGPRRISCFDFLFKAASGPVPPMPYTGTGCPVGSCPPPPPDELQQAADVCAKHIVATTCSDNMYAIPSSTAVVHECNVPIYRSDWSADCTAISNALNARVEAERREAEKPDRDLVAKVAKELKR